MTWIVGAAASLGYAVGISDIRVTFADGSEKDCLQKIYPMARFIAAGFAGSVRIGFSMLNGLAHQLRGVADDQAFTPQEVAECFSPFAVEIFRRSPKQEQNLNSQLMLLGAHPTDDLGIPGYARCYVYTLRSPEFVPKLAKIGEVVSIGSGSAVFEYIQLLDRFTADPLSLIKLETAGIGQSTIMLSMSIERLIQEDPTPGISVHSHICVVSRGSIHVRPNDHNKYPRGCEVIEFRMPRVATNWDEFQLFTSVRSSKGAAC
jgi:hypothetical protein